MSEPLYTLEADGRYVPSELTRGPWDPNAQHGGAPAALLAREIENAEAPTPMRVVRVTYEFLRPLPLAPLTVETEIVRSGKRVQLIACSVTAEGTEVCRALGLRIRKASLDVPEPEPEPPPSRPEDGTPVQFPADGVMFGRDAVEILYTTGSFLETGPAVVWFRLQVPVVGDEQPSPLQRLVTAADFPNGISSTVSWRSHVFINPDTTVYVEREPRGEWVCVDAVSRLNEEGSGVSEGVLFDGEGRVGRSLQGLYVDKR